MSISLQQLDLQKTRPLATHFVSQVSMLSQTIVSRMAFEKSPTAFQTHNLSGQPDRVSGSPVERQSNRQRHTSTGKMTCRCQLSAGLIRHIPCD